jgi:hypothetical protein
MEGETLVVEYSKEQGYYEEHYLEGESDLLASSFLKDDYRHDQTVADQSS